MTATLTSLGVAGARYRLPETEVTLEDWAATTFQRPDFVERLRDNGVRTFRAADETESVSSMAMRAVQDLLDQGVPPLTIDLVIHVHTFRYSVPPPPLSLPELVRRRFGLHRAVGFAFAHQTCGSMLGAIEIVRGMMSVDPGIQRAIIFTADKVLDEYGRAISDGLILSDSASAILLERNCLVNRLLSFTRFTNTEHNPVSPTGHREPGSPSCNGVLNHVKVGRRALAAQTRSLDEFSLILDVNTRHRERHQTLKMLGLDPTLLFDRNIARLGHAFCSDFVINFVDAMRIDPGVAGGCCMVTAAGDVGIYNCMTLQNIAPV